MTLRWTSICASICKGRPLLRGDLEGGRLNPTLTLVRAVVGSCSTCRRRCPGMAMGLLMLSFVLLPMTKVDLATPMTAMRQALAFSNCNISRRLKMVTGQNTKTTPAARSRAGIVASVSITKMNAS